MKNSFVELNARERVHALLDAKSGRELIDPFDQMIAPNLVAQDIVPQSDDGIVVSWNDFWRKRGRDRYGRKIPRWRDR